jgi:putative addiction module component (TIGR02574 family)
VTRPAEGLCTAVLELTQPDRLALAAPLIASLDGEREPGWDEAWLAELDRRETDKTECATTASWHDVRGRILADIAAK